MIRFKRKLIIPVLIFISGFFALTIFYDSVKNTYYYQSSNKSILASGPKSLFKKMEFHNLVIDFSKGELNEEAQNFFIKIDDIPTFNLFKINKWKIANLEYAEIEKDPYVPNNFGEGVSCYKIRNLSLIFDITGEKLLRISVSFLPETDIAIGRTNGSMKNFPLQKNDLIEMFGSGKFFTSFNL